MKKIKKLLSIALCAIIASSLLSACGGSDKGKDNSSSTSTSSTQEIDYSKTNKYTWWKMNDTTDYYTDFSQNPVVQYFNKKFNTTLEFQQPASGTETNAFNTMIATGDYTDIFETSFAGSLDQLYEDGVIIDIGKYLDYMPNFKALLDSDPEYKKNAYNDQGQILKLPTFYTKPDLPWGGLVYRADILKSMTGGNVKFPSGNSVPTTIQDWDYMLPLFKQYFEAAKMKDYAPLIIPAGGFFGYSNILNGFGSNQGYYLDNGKVKCGPLDDGYYNYLVKMREWYKKGYIYKDFASRVNDPFYFPNTALTYGGAAGIWYGLDGQLGTAMSMPDKGLNVEVKAIASPIDTEHGIKTAPDYSAMGKGESPNGPAISTKCKDVERLLASLDYFYGKEGSMIFTFGLDAQNAANNELLNKVGLKDGLWSQDANGNVKFSEAFKTDKTLIKNWESLNGTRMCGLKNNDYNKPLYDDNKASEYKLWTTYSSEGFRLPFGMTRTVDEDKKFQKNQTSIDDYVKAMVVKFILGAEELNQTTWSQFKAQLEKYGIEENIAIQQAEYDRFNKR